MNDDEVLAAAEALFEGPTPGPWRFATTGYSVRTSAVPQPNAKTDIVCAMNGGADRYTDLLEQWADDAVFIAAAREGWLEAVAIARRLQGENAELRETLVAARETIDGYDANQNRLVAENAALTERLRIAEERIARAAEVDAAFDPSDPLDPDDNAHTLRRAFRVALALPPASDAAPKEAT